MSVYRNCYLFRSSDPDFFLVNRPSRKKGESQNDAVRYADCRFYMGIGDDVTRIVDHVHGNTYYTAPDCRVFQ